MMGVGTRDTIIKMSGMAPVWFMMIHEHMRTRIMLMECRYEIASVDEQQKSCWMSFPCGLGL